ncbi:unnamed protein product [Rotaria sp. Silwood1]|nr:unnamed protein product [Rotaria sp. Silwood1]CAF4713292.1 unnamed protein product [Rotaria sp. Silwood1]CAF4733515.1 unnamed protein product [Rotaria sp. Silwood1]
MKELTQMSNDLPVQIITNVIATTSREIQPCLPGKDALRQQIKRAKRVCDEEVERQPLNDFKLPDAYSITFSGVPFMKDITDGTERILLFTTNENLKWLQEAKFWIMDGTFKTVPTLFRQLYSSHAPAGGNVNSQIIPLVYALMSAKREELYQRLSQQLNELVDGNKLKLNPDFVLTDFEKGSINAVKSEFPTAQSKGCRFHLVEMEIEKSMRGEPAPKKRKEDEDTEVKIQNVIADRGNRSTTDFLRSIAHNLSL